MDTHAPFYAGDDFLGREVFMYLVIKTVLKRRFVALLGAPGVGKTAVATQACHYMAQRAYFSDGVFFVRL
ncbi:unnamed protein product, partial [Discosporangium mesarthrocarpum]